MNWAISVHRPKGSYADEENGIKIAIFMEGINRQVPLCWIEPGNNNPYDQQYARTDAERLRTFGENLWFDPIPLEMLYTPAYEPQVRVTVDGLDSVCPEENCGYTYIESIGSLSDVELVGSRMFVRGAFVNEQAHAFEANTPIKVKLAGAECVLSNEYDPSSNVFECDLAGAPQAGEHRVSVTGPYGDFDNTSTPLFTVDLVIDTVEPSTDLNPFGGNTVVISGSGFSNDASEVSVTFDDGTICKVTVSTSTSITCRTQRFDQSNIKEEYDLTISFNEQTVETTVSLGTYTQYANTISPTSVSPVLRSDLLIQLDDTFTGELAVEHFRAELNLVSEITTGHWAFDYETGLFNWIEDEQTAWPLFVKSVDAAAKTVTISFRGASSGIYTVILYSSSLGRLNDQNLQITTESYLTGISPRQGSAVGGTLVTISGSNFSDEPKDNPVMIGESLCLVEESSHDEIKCRIARREAVDEAFTPEEVQVSVLLKLAETATTCDDCSFTFVEPSAEVTDEKHIWVTGNTMKLIVEGTGLCSTSEPQAVMMIDGREQELMSCDESQAVYKLEVTKRDNKGFDILLGDGYPKGHNIILKKSVWFDIYLTEVLPLKGSVGGQRLTLKGFGFGVEFNGADIIIEHRVDSDW